MATFLRSSGDEKRGLTNKEVKSEENKGGTQPAVFRGPAV